VIRNRLLRAVCGRLVGMIVVMLLVVTVVFVIVRIAPGDPASVMLGPQASPAAVAALRTSWGLDRPLPVQYLLFVGQVLRGDLGRSIFLNEPVLSALAQRAEPTTFLTLFSILIAVVIALPVGILAAYKRGSAFDQVVMTVSMFAASIPTFWLGLLLIEFFAVRFHWLPASGYGGPGASLGDRLSHLILPAVTLGVASSALITRFTRASMLDVLSDDYVRTARSKGMGEMRVVLRHALKNALVPILTVIGLTVAVLIAGAVVTETVFGLPGVGSLVVSAVLRRDYPVIQGVVLLFSFLYVLINLIVDLLYTVFDPRIRY
jgi:peptide/nickel transport system permease protein